MINLRASDNGRTHNTAFFVLLGFPESAGLQIPFAVGRKVVLNYDISQLYGRIIAQQSLHPVNIGVICLQTDDRAAVKDTDRASSIGILRLSDHTAIRIGNQLQMFSGIEVSIRIVFIFSHLKPAVGYQGNGIFRKY